MIRGLYTSASAMLTQELRQETVTNNLANLSTPGFKEVSAINTTFPEVLVGQFQAGKWQPLGIYTRGATVDELNVKWNQGPLYETGRSEDLALEGEGFFTVLLDDGQAAYTRNGSFILDEEGYLVTARGYRVEGENGPIWLGGDNWQVDARGVVLEDGVAVDALRIVGFHASNFQNMGEGLYRPLPGNAMREWNELKTGVRQGYLEGSNVDAAGQAEQMLEALRTFEANQQIIRIYDELLKTGANEIGFLR